MSVYLMFVFVCMCGACSVFVGVRITKFGRCNVNQ